MGKPAASLFSLSVGCFFWGVRKFMSLLVAPSEPQTLVVGLRRIVVPAHG
ncbi:hypothetical protein Pla52n_70100 [Stieleria varia]|uniref:Uncharacterized protein n=1 Tax=Stieleria varia TaxID=2528005 RepID=A0A5C5ZLP4_9BACT|nr:hypothetical protein Pla52n_70100 [Stieleria varia]